MSLRRESLRSILSLGVASIFALLAQAQDTVEKAPTPLRQAHAHNDYRHPHPLLDALNHGFCSVEADIFLVEGALLVGHDRDELTPDRTLQSLYLEPLRQRTRKNGGRVYRDGPTITLLIDIKEDGAATYRVLRGVLASYREILSSVENGVVHEGAVQVVISGDRPGQDIAADATRYAAIDGRLTDLDSKAPAHLLPLISDRWTEHFRWRGDGEFPNEEREKLRGIVHRAHAAGRRIRFWATPENAAVWRELAAMGVDHINTDDLAGLRDFLASRRDELPGETLMKTLSAILTEQATAWNRGDLDAFMEHYWKSDDLTFSSGGKTTRGWSATKANYERRYATRQEMGHLTFDQLEVTPLGETSALMLGEWKLKRDAGPLEGGFSLVFRQIDGQWAIVHDHTSRRPTP